MAEKCSDTYLTPYRKAQHTHGSDFQVTLWASPRSQRRRFEIFARMHFLAGKRILDAGCSRGDFAAYLLEKSIHYGRYIGIDGLSEVIDYAQTRNLPDSEFHVGDIVAQPEVMAIGQPQVVVISGTLNTMNDQDIHRVLEGAWQAASEALMFNFLSDRTSPQATPQGEPARRLDTMAMLDWAMQKTWAVQFRQDYFMHGHDATILMRKPPRE